ncbi:cation diffusion facilitator CzcD-associated flavoprotein CzcO [Bradyrhizobium sp. GM2.4]
MSVAEETRRPTKGGHKNKQGIEATMNVAVRSHATAKQASEHFDVLIVGAGISGIGSAYHMTKQLPGASFVILETQATFGGTWTTHRYPGIRSDSDLHTFGYSFKPWVGPPIATAEEILAYMNEVIDENDIARHIRYSSTRSIRRAGRASKTSGLSRR